jgi:uncharacterized phage-associated protein
MSNEFDVRKAIEVVVYVSHKTDDLLHIMKVLYFADKYHLQEYGRLITGDKYIAMKDGPVPSGAYEIVKDVRGDGIVELSANTKQALRVEKRIFVKPQRDPILDYLSESDIECLDRAISEYANMPREELLEIAHDEQPYKEAQADNDITLKSIVQSLPNSADVLAYMTS